MNADADNETQLVHLEGGKATADGKVDLLKVKDILRAMRRRYQTRTHLQTYFKDWDDDRTGYLESPDIKKMLDKMGLKVNNEEADLIVLSIDSSGDKKISLGEFLDLVYTHNDGLT